MKRLFFATFALYLGQTAPLFAMDRSHQRDANHEAAPLGRQPAGRLWENQRNEAHKKKSVEEAWKHAERSLNALLAEERTLFAEAAIDPDANLLMGAWKRMEALEKIVLDTKNKMQEVLEWGEDNEDPIKATFTTLKDHAPLPVLRNIRNTISNIMLLERPDFMTEGLQRLLSLGEKQDIPEETQTQDLNAILSDLSALDIYQTDGENVSEMQSAVSRILKLEDERQEALQKLQEDQDQDEVAEKITNRYATDLSKLTYSLQSLVRSVNRGLELLPTGEVEPAYFRNFLDKMVSLLCDNHLGTRDLLLSLSYPPTAPQAQ